MRRADQWSTPLRVVVMLAVLCGFGLLQWLLWPLILTAPYIFFYPAVVVVSMLLGFRYGVVAALIAVFVAQFFFIPPILTFNFHWPDGVFRPFLFGVAALLMAWVTEALRKARKQLLENEKQLSLIIETIPQLVWRTNLDGSADFFSQSFLTHVGFPAEQVLGWGWLELIHPDDRPGVEKEWARCRDARIPVSWPFRVRGANGEYRWILSQGNPFRGPSGEVEKYYGTWTDISEQKAIEAKLLETIRARDEFLSIASHELKTPLTSLLLQLHMNQRAVRKGDPRVYEPERVNRLVDLLEKQGARLARLVDDMLDVGRIRSGKLTIHKEEFDLCELVHEVTERHAAELTSATGVAPQFHRCESAVGRWDRGRIEQVAANLLTNAAKYGQGSPVEIRVEHLGDRVRLRVRDSGLGIAKEHQERIFDRFERAVSANEISGLGLGLFISRQIVQAHGGRIWVESELGQGATFFVELPMGLEATRT